MYPCFHVTPLQPISFFFRFPSRLGVPHPTLRMFGDARIRTRTWDLHVRRLIMFGDRSGTTPMMDFGRGGSWMSGDLLFIG